MTVSDLPMRFGIAFEFEKDEKAMDYETEDLTRKPASYPAYRAIRLSLAKNPREIDGAIWKNLRELDSIVDGVLIHGKNFQALRDFFQAANKGDNIRNVVASGSELNNSSGHFTFRIQAIGQKIDRYVKMNEKFPDKFPQAQTLRNIWEQGRGEIPDVLDVVKKTQIKVESTTPAAEVQLSSRVPSSAKTPQDAGFVFQPLV